MLTLSLGIITLSPSTFKVQLPQAHATSSSFTLFGRILSPGGWGFTSTTVASPGPALVVAPGDTVTVTLNSGDSVTHNWGVDYNGNGTCDPGEPCSGSFGGTFPSPTTFTFTATSTTGNHTYFCFIHHAPMLGTFVVRNPFTLFGRVLAPAGWGFTSNTVASPGPAIVVAPGATVKVALNSGDGATHNWGVDYNGNQICDAGEPCSQNFGSTSTSLTFTATTTPGDYTYWCFIHLGAMHGTFTVKPRDVAVSGLAVSRNTAYNGVTTTNPIQVNVTTQNLGPVPENYAVYAKANNTLIGNKTITLPAASTSVVSFLWNNTQSLARGVYILTANATRVTGETSFGNNQLSSGTFTVKLRGDVNGDCKVDIVDLSSVGAAFGKTTGTIGFNPNTDLNNDGGINIVDLVLVAGSFGQAC